MFGSLPALQALPAEIYLELLRVSSERLPQSSHSSLTVIASCLLCELPSDLQNIQLDILWSKPFTMSARRSLRRERAIPRSFPGPPPGQRRSVPTNFMLRVYEMTADTLDAFVLGVSDSRTTRMKHTLLMAQLDAVSALFESHQPSLQAQVSTQEHDLGKRA